MNVTCPYCSATVDIVHLERHVRLLDNDGHGAYGTIPVDDVDNPWHLRLDLSGRPVESKTDDDVDIDVPSVKCDVDEVRRGRCPACDRGVLGFKGGNGFLSSGRRRLACPNCGWQSPKWVKIRE